ncbi:MAG: N-6 DNA methylase [Thermoguttaceae bacterium]|jgi:hypothetical protein|nr:N-6 DNA methylase [Thermoguttaceae bacterium]
MAGFVERLDACFGARSALAAESLRGLCAAIARDEPGAFSAWRDVAARLYGGALDALSGHLEGLSNRAGIGPYGLSPDRVLFALQTYYALVVRGVSTELCGEDAARTLDEPVFGWADACDAPEAAKVVERVSAAARECRADAEAALAGHACDLFKPLYQSVFPRALRHALGEYYTPDWLADHVLEQAGWPGDPGARLLDPACGSGTFLVAAIRELRRTCRPHVTRQEQLDHILARVAGFDLNPLAVLTSRANYLIAVRDLLPAAGAVPVPVFCCDSICDEPPAFALGDEELFDLLVGNPPWIAWDNLPASYRRATLPLWRRYGLFSLDGNAGRHGGAKKDLAMLLLYATADRFLREGGRAAMVLSQTLLHTHGAGDGFRRFRLGPEGCPLAVLRVDDLSRLRPFPEAANCTATLLLEKGRPTVYPVPYVRWLPGKEHGKQGGPGSPRVEHFAEPVDPARPGSPWFVRPRALRTPLHQLAGPSDYTARLGANSAGANGVYWVELLGPAAGGGVLVRNLAGAGRRQVEQVECVVEPALLFPLLRWGDVARYRARPAAFLLLPQDPGTRAGLAPDVMQARYPRTCDYFARFEPLLRRRAAYRRYQEDRPFYSMYNVGPYTLAGIKVVWRRMDSRLTAAVVEPVDHPLLGRRPVIPQETCVLVDCATSDEAHYLCALMNSATVGFLVAAHSVAGGKGFGTPGILTFTRLRRFDPGCEIHRRLAAASRAAHSAAATGGGRDGSAGVAGFQQEIDAAAAALWGLDAAEQQAIATVMS